MCSIQQKINLNANYFSSIKQKQVQLNFVQSSQLTLLEKKGP